ncbi:MAG: methyltransferase domain-containing protein [Rhodospirillales bacterium]|nr:methyltransferase domain-containing protein [Rhodospirillales bacterium]
MTWNPELYLAFEGPRFRPVIDLVQQIGLEAPTRVVDMGCGTGSGTQLMKSRWPDAHFTGVDGSADMLAKARDADPAIDWIEADLNLWTPDTPPDLIFSNAALHWLDDHHKLFPRLLDMLAPGGVLAVQMPRNYHAPGLSLVNETALDGPWRPRLEAVVRQVPVQEPRFYYELIAPRVKTLNMWETDFIQVLDGDNPVADWTRGSWMSPLLNALDGDERDAFDAEYRRRVAAAYPREKDGKTLFPFRRIFFIATV